MNDTRRIKRCHDCGAKVGEPHGEGCDSPTCTICGVQLLLCGHYPEGNSIHSGVESQEVKILAEAFRLYCRWDDEDGGGWLPCSKEAEGATYDLNRAKAIYQSALRKVREWVNG